MNHLDWISDLPKAWDVGPLRAVADCRVSNVDKVTGAKEAPVQLCNYTDVYNNEFIHLGLDLMQATASKLEIERFRLSVGDVVITKDSETWEDIGVPALVIETADDLLCGYHLALLRPKAGVMSGRFLLRLLQARQAQVQLELAAKGMTRYGLPKYEIGKIVLPLPPLPTQIAIADYLDRETARLDALTLAQKRLLPLLAEKRRTFITRAVTRGLHPSAPLRDSGIVWLNEVPEHWEIWKLGHLATVGNGSTPSRSNESYWANEDVPWLNSGVVKRPEITSADQFVTKLAIRRCHLPIVRRGAVLIAITGQGKTRGRASVLSIDATISQHLAFIQPRDRFRPWFLRWVLVAAYDFLRSISDDAGGTKGALTCEQIANLRVPVPPLNEQDEILSQVTAAVAKTESCQSAVERTISIIKERRAAVISDAVAGKLDLGSTT